MAVFSIGELEYELLPQDEYLFSVIDSGLSGWHWGKGGFVSVAGE